MRHHGSRSTTATDAAIRAALVDGPRPRSVGRDVALTDDQDAAIRTIRRDLRADHADAAAAPGRRRLGQDGGRRIRAGRRRPRRPAGGAARPDGPPGAPAPRDAGVAPRRRSESPVTLLTGSLRARAGRHALEASRRARRRSSSGRTRCIQDAVHVRATSASSSSTSSTGSASSSAAQLEAKAGGRRAARPAHDRDADPADARPGALRGPRRVGPADAARGPASRSGPGIRRPDELAGTWEKVRDEAAAGHRTFVVVPLIEEGGRPADDGRRASVAAPRARRFACASCWRRCASGWSTAG